MKRLSIFVAILASAALLSCNKQLDLAPIDYYGSGSYWKNESHVKSYLIGLHKNMRDVSWTHMMLFGEMRGGGVNNAGATIDGSAINYGDLVNQNLNVTSMGGITNYGDYYGKITNCNLFIKKVTEAEFLTAENKAYYLGMGYGLRAFYFYDLYRVYGKIPLRTGIEVIEGVLDPQQLYMEQSECDAVVAQIKSDLEESYKQFGSANNFDPMGLGNDKNYWSKAATECLMADFYLWISKVSMGNYNADVSNLAAAKTHLNNVINNFGLGMLDNFAKVLDAKNKNNKEIIFAVAYSETEATNSLGTFAYNTTTGMAYQKFYRADGETLFGDPLGLKGGTVMRNEHKLGLYNMFDDDDTRRDATFVPVYNAKAEWAEKGALAGLITSKNLGYMTNSGTWSFCGDFPYYRLSWCYLALAEIANMEGDNAGVVRNINEVRKRAYGAKWNEATYGYKAGDFTQNELAILHEKDKEFVQEGQRWWDVRRMTLTKGGKALVFCPEGNIDNNAPLLTDAEAYKLLWPLDKTLLSKDPALKQTPGYDN